MAKKKKKKKVKKAGNWVKPVGWKRPSAGRPTLPDDDRRDNSLRFRTTKAETNLMELASRFCNFRQRSRWAMSRLLILARSVVKSKGIDPNSSHSVKKALKHVRRGLK